MVNLLRQQPIKTIFPRGFGHGEISQSVEIANCQKYTKVVPDKITVEYYSYYKGKHLCCTYSNLQRGGAEQQESGNAHPNHVQYSSNGILQTKYSGTEAAGHDYGYDFHIIETGQTLYISKLTKSFVNVGEVYKYEWKDM